MAIIHMVDRSSPDPLGSICRAADIATHEIMKRRGYPPTADYREFPISLRDEIHREVISRTRELLG